MIRLPRRRTVGAARNAGLARVRTPFVLVADADDLVLDGALEHLAGPLRSDPGLVAVVGAVIEDGSRPHPSPRAAARWSSTTAAGFPERSRICWDCPAWGARPRISW